MPLALGMCTSTTSTPTLTQSQPDGTQDALTAARLGDRDAFAALITPHVPRLQRLARRFTRSAEDAEDVCQESLLKAFTKLDRFSGTQVGMTEFRAWLMRITANCAIDFLRRKQPYRFIPLDQCSQVPSKSHEASGGGWGENPESSFTRQEQFGAVVDAITTLPAELRIVCLLRNISELSTKEVASHLGISSIAVRLRLFRAHGQLRKSLGVRSKHSGENCPAARTRTARYVSRRRNDIESLRLRESIPAAQPRAEFAEASLCDA